MYQLDAKELKQYIYEKDLIQDLLEKVGLHSFMPLREELRCALPDENDNSKVSIKYSKDLEIRVFTKAETLYGDIYHLICFIDKCEFPEAYKKCLNILGISGTYKKTNKKDDLQLFKKLKRKKDNEIEQQCYDLSILNKYQKEIHIDLIRKDSLIDLKMLDKYHIMFDSESGRIIFPHFKHDDKTKVVGVIGRTINPAYQSLKIPKYFSMEGKYLKNRNLYGLSHNVEEIKQRGYVLVFEAEKSVIKADMYGHPCGVAVGSHDLSDFQKKLLISLGVEIIICFDKDVEKSHIEKTSKQIGVFRTVSYIEDKWGLLNEKDSPVDRGVKRFNFLFKHRTKL